VNQLGFPSSVTALEIQREKTLGGAIALCARAADMEPKQVQDGLKLDKAQWSRWESGSEGIVWPKFLALMDFCGNDSPLLWMAHARGYDLSSIRRRETDLEKQLREAQQQITQLQHDKRVLVDALRGAA
jgi:hypothetical protein